LARALIAAIKPWNADHYHAWRARTAHESALITRRDELTSEIIERLRPDFLFLPHWSWLVPPEIFERVETVGFHMADLPDGRGGSPLQNQILRGVTHTQLCAFRVQDGVDTGDVYLTRPLCLSGSAEEIYIRASALAFEMIDEILTSRPQPRPQQGTVTTFRRRTPAESRIPEGLSLAQLFDFIRMLDADGYPHAFIEHGPMRFSFTRASLRNGRLEADVTIEEHRSG
jgi:methionyl-tRNA formyltransferase